MIEEKNKRKKKTSIAPKQVFFSFSFGETIKKTTQKPNNNNIPG